MFERALRRDVVAVAHEYGMQAERRHHDALVGHEPMAEDGRAGGLAVAHDARGLPEARQDPPRHATERPRPRLDFGLEHRSERVEIVARHDRSRRRQHVEQLRIAVVGDVEYVERVTPPRQRPRIVPHPVDEAVRGVRHTPRSLLSTEASDHHRPDQRCVDAFRLERRPVHGRDEVHARPALFGEVGDDRDTHRPAHRVELISQDGVWAGAPSARGRAVLVAAARRKMSTRLRAYRTGSKRDSDSRAPCRRRRYSESSRRDSTIASARSLPSGRRPRASRPLTPSVSHSEMPPTSNAATGIAWRAASRPTRPNGSGQTLGTTSKCDVFHNASRCSPSAQPTNSTVTPSTSDCTFFACFSQASRAGPLPANVTRIGLPRATRTAGSDARRRSPPFSVTRRPRNSSRYSPALPATSSGSAATACRWAPGGGSVQTRSRFTPLAMNSRAMCSEFVTTAAQRRTNRRRYHWRTRSRAIVAALHPPHLRG